MLIFLLRLEIDPSEAKGSFIGTKWSAGQFNVCRGVGPVAAFIVWVGYFPQWKISKGRRPEAPLPFRASKSARLATHQAPIRNAMKMIGVDLPLCVQQAQGHTSAAKRERCHLGSLGFDKKVPLTRERCKRPVCAAHNKCFAMNASISKTPAPWCYRHWLHPINENWTFSVYNMLGLCCFSFCIVIQNIKQF